VSSRRPIGREPAERDIRVAYWRVDRRDGAAALFERVARWLRRTGTMPDGIQWHDGEDGLWLAIYYSPPTNGSVMDDPHGESFGESPRRWASSPPGSVSIVDPYATGSEVDDHDHSTTE
jgi:hypothetical protein